MKATTHIAISVGALAIAVGVAVYGVLVPQVAAELISRCWPVIAVAVALVGALIWRLPDPSKAPGLTAEGLQNVDWRRERARGLLFFQLGMLIVLGMLTLTASLPYASARLLPWVPAVLVGLSAGAIVYVVVVFCVVTHTMQRFTANRERDARREQEIAGFIGKGSGRL